MSGVYRHRDEYMTEKLETSPVDLQATVRKIAALVQEQQSGIARLEHENIETTAQQSAEMVASLRNAGCHD